MIAPLIKPITAPATRLAAMPSMTLPVALATMAQVTPAKATVEPTERSKSREARQNIMVQATMPICETDKATLTMLSQEKKYGTVPLNTANSTTKISARL